MPRGRPKIPAEQVRKRTVRFRCTADDEAEMERRAAAAGLTLSEWMRQRLLAPEEDASNPA